MQTLTKLPPHIPDLHHLITSSSNPPSTYLQIFSAHPHQAKLLLTFLQQHLVSDFLCYFNSKTSHSPTFAHCQLFCQDFYRITERQQQAQKQKSRNLASIIIFTVIKLIWLSILYTNITPYFLPSLSTQPQSCPIMSQLITGQNSPSTLAYVKSLLWGVSMILYALGGIAFSLGLIVHCVKSLIINCREMEEIKREKRGLVNGDAQ